MHGMILSGMVGADAESQGGKAPVKKLHMILKTIVTATSPWVRIPRPPL